MRMILPLFLVGLAAANAVVEDYGTLILGFDSECSKDSESTLVDYIVDRANRSSRSSTTPLSSSELRAFLESEIDSERQIIESQVNMHFRREAAERRGRSLKTSEAALTERTLGETPRSQREDEILSALHLMAVAAIGGDRAVDLLTAERDGDVAGMIDIITASNPLDLTSEEIGGLVRATRGGSKQLVTKSESLEFLEMKMVSNPVLGKRLMDYAALLPCLKHEPAPNRLIDPEPMEFEIDEVAGKAGRAVTTQLDIVTPEAIKLRLAEEARTGKLSYAGKLEQTVSMERPTEFTLKLWPLLTQIEGTNSRHGVGAESAWATFARDFELERNPDYAKNSTLNLTFKQMMKDMASHYPPPEIAVIDTGCTRHVDLVHQFWRNYETPGCTDQTFVGERGDLLWPGNCVGYDFNSGVPDPTINNMSPHGTTVSGCVTAEADNGKAVIGVCPWCKVACLKAASPAGQLDFAAVAKAFDYVLAKKFKIVNCSYGYYGDSAWYEEQAFELATNSGVLVMTSAGNKATDTQSTPHFPSGYGFKGMMSIGGSDSEGEIYQLSNYGKKSVSVFSPGAKMTVLYNLEQTATSHGTSLASPIAASVAAMVWMKYPDLTSVQVADILMESAMPSSALVGKAKTGGIVAAHRALAYADLVYGN